MQNNAMEKVGAGFFVRLAAYIVDSIIVGAALLTVRFPLWILRLSDGNNILFRDIIFKYSITDILFYVLHVTYFILMTYFAGATLGKRLFHIRVVSSENRDFTFFEIVYRETVGRFLSSIILYIGYLMVIVNGDKLGLHDILSDTRVVYCHVKKMRVQPPVSYKNVPPQNGVPYQGNMPQQSGMPYQGNVPQQSGMPYQGNVPQQGGMPYQGNVPQQSGMPYQENVPQQSGMPYQENVPQQNGTPTQGNEPPHI